MVCLKSLVMSAMLGLTYRCATSLRKFDITVARADAAVYAGGDTRGLSGYPHEFFNKLPGGGVAVKFYGGDKQCNQAYSGATSPMVEYPVFSDGTLWKKDEDKDRQGRTPARVVYLKDGLRLCGVMTHLKEDPDHKGEGPFKACDWIGPIQAEL